LVAQEAALVAQPTVVGVSIVLAVSCCNYSYMIAIPTIFLVEADTLAERNTWPLECTAKMFGFRIASAPSASRDAPIWTADANLPTSTALFNPVGCTVTKLARPVGGGVCDFCGRRPRALHDENGRPASGVGLFFDVAGNTKTPIEVTEGQSVILSIRRKHGSVAPPSSILQHCKPLSITGVGRGREKVVTFRDWTPADCNNSSNLTAMPGLVVARGLSELIWVGIDEASKDNGKPEGRWSRNPRPIARVDGWVAWVPTGENNRIALHGRSRGTGNHQVPKGRGITSLAVSPDAGWIALSVTSSLSIGSTQDTVPYSRVCRRLGKFSANIFGKGEQYTPPAVAFPDAGRFIYTDLEGVHVLKVVP